MLTKVNIKNFKSIRDLEFSPKRVNVFIGEPNTGKTNILEALAMLSEGVHGPLEFKEVFRFRNVSDLFTDQQVSVPISVTAAPKGGCQIRFDGQQFKFDFGQDTQSNLPLYSHARDQVGHTSSWTNPQLGVKYYRFKPSSQTSNQGVGALQPPFGVNLTSILYTNKSLRGHVSDLFRTRQFRLEIRPVEMELRLAKTVGDDIYSFPYESTSETWRRIVFYMAVLETNQNSTILLDEPEANTFPFYTKYMAERVALDESNQFFITTHNPYLLSSVVEKTPTKDLAIYVTTMENYETKVKLVSEKNLSELLSLDADAFFNLDKLVDE